MSLMCSHRWPPAMPGAFSGMNTMGTLCSMGCERIRSMAPRVRCCSSRTVRVPASRRLASRNTICARASENYCVCARARTRQLFSPRRTLHMACAPPAAPAMTLTTTTTAAAAAAPTRPPNTHAAPAPSAPPLPPANARRVLAEANCWFLRAALTPLSSAFVAVVLALLDDTYEKELKAYMRPEQLAFVRDTVARCARANQPGPVMALFFCMLEYDAALRERCEQQMLDEGEDASVFDHGYRFVVAETAAMRRNPVTPSNAQLFWTNYARGIGTPVFARDVPRMHYAYEERNHALLRAIADAEQKSKKRARKEAAQLARTQQPRQRREQQEKRRLEEEARKRAADALIDPLVAALGRLTTGYELPRQPLAVNLDALPESFAQAPATGTLITDLADDIETMLLSSGTITPLDSSDSSQPSTPTAGDASDTDSTPAAETPPPPTPGASITAHYPQLEGLIE